jgi:rhamnosyltransferase
MQAVKSATQNKGRDPWRDVVPPVLGNICAIVVTYHPDAGFPARLTRLSQQFPCVFVIDNASSDLEIEQNDRIRILQNDRNIGIAAALNIGLSRAEKAGYAWSVTFDQDSEPVDTFIDAMVASLKVVGTCRLLLGANYVDVHRRRSAHRSNSQGSVLIPKTTLITSGMLLPVSFARAIGGFREDFFIDSVDHEFCLRASDHGARCYVTREPLMCHSIGVPVNNFRWARTLSSGHSSMRKYFIARNALWTVRLHAHHHPLWALRQFVRIGAEAVGILLFETDRLAKLAALLRGIKDGITVEVRHEL